MIERVDMALPSPILTAGRAMTCEVSNSPELIQSISKMDKVTPLLGKNYFDIDLCYAPSKFGPGSHKRHPIKLCKDFSQLPDTQLSPPITRDEN